MTIEAKESLELKQRKAEALLDRFSIYADGYQHGANNQYLKWLESNPILTIKQVVDFILFWYPISRQQPQILALCMAALPKWNDRKKVWLNLGEEDGLAKEGQEPHYYLLQQLIKKLNKNFVTDQIVVKNNGEFEIEDNYPGDSEANALMTEFHDTLYKKMTPAEVSGLLAAIEHPALDISAYFNKVIELCGRPDLLKSDLYLSIHVEVEPDHIIWAHGTAEQYMKEDQTDEVVNAFKSAMSFWNNFWAVAFTKLGYPA